MNRARLTSLDALRGIAALLVLAFHYEGLLRFVPPNGHPPADSLWCHYGAMGVELFFILSGFVILMSIEASPTIRRFLIHRAARLYPAYGASVVLAAALLLSWDETTVATAAVNLTMLQRFVSVPDLVAPYWSLAFELWFYVLVAAIAWRGALRRVPALALAWFAFAVTMQCLGRRPPSTKAVIVLWQHGHLFIAGMMLHRLYAGKGTRLVRLALALSIGYSLFGRDDWARVSRTGYFFVNASFIGSVYLASAGRLGWIARPWLISVGAVSYSLYLLHLPIGLALTRAATAAGLPSWVGVAAAVPASFAAASLSRRFIELPGQRLLRRVGAGSPAGPETSGWYIPSDDPSQRA